MTATKKKFKKKLVITSVIASVVLLMLIVGAIFYVLSDMTRVVDRQLIAIKKGNMPRAYGYASQAFQQATSLAQFEKFIEDHSILKEIIRTHFTSKEVTGDAGVLRGTLYAQDGTVIPVMYRLVKEEGRWKILEMKVNPAEGSEGYTPIAAA
ncbi:MAG TPA: DUF4864 domain-containing protein, partial [Gammaproteobacteria bacterium]|nr:DUF4864 domain-containing protein [Gammaproteobacteria bacterium]